MVFGFVGGFILGTVVGAYAAQNYELPAIKEYVQTFKEVSEKYKKKDTPKDDS